MNVVLEILDNDFLLGIGSGLLHFVWQGTAVACVLSLALRILRHAAPELRYTVCWAALVVMAAMPALSITRALTSQSEPLPYNQSALPGAEAVTENPTSSARQEIGLPAEPVRFSAVQFAARLLRESRPYVALSWIFGVMLFAARLQRGLYVASRLKLDISEKPETGIIQTLHRLRSKMGIGREVTLKISRRVDQPVLIGWLKPVILLPASILTGLLPDHVDAILAHELAHIKRHDYFFSTVQSVIETLFFFHPAVWWVSNRIRIEREYCCDDLAVAALQNKKTYLDTLAGLESYRLPALSPSLSMNGGSLLARVKRLVERPAPHRERVLVNMYSYFIGFILFVCACTTIAACSKLSLTDEPEEPLTAGIELPTDLEQKIAGNDIEGVISQLHYIREAGHPDALSITYTAYEKAFDEELRRNLVFVFAHFNSFEADELLIHAAKTDIEESVRGNALRAISLRLGPESRIRLATNSFYAEDADLYQYPRITGEQLDALNPSLAEIAMDEEEVVHIRQRAVRILAFEGRNRALIEELFQNARDKRVRLSALKNLDLGPDELVNTLVAMLDENDSESANFQIAFEIAQTGSLAGVAPLMELAKKEAGKEIPLMYVNALVMLVHNLPASTYPEVRRLIDYDDAMNRDWGVFQQDMEHLLKKISG